MLYFVTYTAKDRTTKEIVTLVKVGKTSKIAARLMQYLCYNPTAEFLGHKVGYTKAEKATHKRMERLGCKHFRSAIRSEWFTLPDGTTPEELAKLLKFEPFE